MRVTSLGILLVALAGFVDSLYLSWGALTGNALRCGVLEGCNVVAQSPYSWVFGVVPLATFGVVYYIGMLGLSASLLWAPFPQARFLTVLWAGLGVLFSMYFMYLQAFVIGAFCIYCIISAVATLLLFTLALITKK